MRFSPIPNTKPWITGRETAAVTACLESGALANRPEGLVNAKEALHRIIGHREVLLTGSCTQALELALRCLRLEADDEVVVPAFTFMSTANAVLQCGAKVVLADIDERILGITPGTVASRIGRRTKAVIPVHYAGISCEMDALLTLVHGAGAAVVEDAAHALGARYNGKPLGTLGDFGALSFHATKNCTCSEGGALILNNSLLAACAEWIHDNGTDRAAFLRGEASSYTWVGQGGNFVLSPILAALLAAQLDRFAEIQAARQRINRTYRESLLGLQERGLIQMPDVPVYAECNDHIAYFLVGDGAVRDPLLAHLREQGIGASQHYPALHLTPFGKKFLDGKPGQFPVAERVAASIVRLPLFPTLESDDQLRVIEAVRGFFAAPAPRIPLDRADIDLSLVIPCYNEAGHLEESLDTIIRTLEAAELRYELIVIDDASRDATPAIIRQYAAKHPDTQWTLVFHPTNAGRGATVAEGIRLARGTVTGFLDIDLEIGAAHIAPAVQKLLDNRCDAVIAKRSFGSGPRFLGRTAMSHGHRLLTSWMLGIPAMDINAGFKFFRREKVLPLLENATDAHWSWDIEITVLTLDAGLRVLEQPVQFLRRADKASTVKPVRDSLHGLQHLVRLRRQRRLRSTRAGTPATTA